MTTGVDAFDTTVQKTNVWLKEIMEEMGWDDRHRAYLALRAVLHALRDRMAVEETAHLGAQLPMLIRGIYFDGWSPAGKPIKYKREDLLSFIHGQFMNQPNIDAERVAKAVFKVISHRVAEGEIEEIKGLLPRELRTFWES